MEKISIRKTYSKPAVLFSLFLIAFLGFIWTGYSSFEERVITVRYFLFALVALIAFLTPYILFPDQNVSVLQLGNLSESDFRKYILEKVFRLSWPLFLLIPIMFFGDLYTPYELLFDKMIYSVGCLSLFSGVVLLS
ncbi:MAG: hypothetical protein R3220_06585, partial [Balneolaceae bacterium]|nr:hypothetical protein [Balneolaceae bacterium]